MSQTAKDQCTIEKLILQVPKDPTSTEERKDEAPPFPIQKGVDPRPSL